MSVRPAHPIQDVIYGLGIKFFCVDRIACPFPIALKILVPWLEDDLQELLVAVWTSAILWRAAALTSKADRLRGAGGGGQDLLQYYFMPPVVSEIVNIDHRL